MKITDKDASFSAYEDLKELAAFQRYINALNLPSTPEQFASWRRNRSHDKSLWEWNADTPFPTKEREQ